MAQCISRNELADVYYQSLSAERGRPAKDARLVIGAVIIKHKQCLLDVETVLQIQENLYVQYLVELAEYQMEVPFASSLFLEILKHMGESVFEGFHQAIVDVHEGEKLKSRPESVPQEALQNNPQKEFGETPAPASEAGSIIQVVARAHQGNLILDDTVVEQAICYPTELSLLNEVPEYSKQIFDALYFHTPMTKKSRTYREKARKAFLAIAKQRRPSGKTLRRGIKQQLQYLRSNLGHIDQLLTHFTEGTEFTLPHWLLHRYWVIQHLYKQQWGLVQSKTRC